MTIDWESFWRDYRAEPAQTMAELFVKVGKTVDKKPISASIFRVMIEQIASSINLQADNQLLELCCGNGLLTLPLSHIAKHIVALDFSQHLIDQAKRFKQADNIIYIHTEVLTYLSNYKAECSFTPTKFLMNDSLAYFEPKQLDSILRAIINICEGDFLFLISGIPNDDLKWNFYNTPERMKRYQENQKNPQNSNDGLGRWWEPIVLKELAEKNSLSVKISNQIPMLSNYRMNALFECNY